MSTTVTLVYLHLSMLNIMSCNITEETLVQIAQEKIRKTIFFYTHSDVLSDSKPCFALSNSKKTFSI